MDTPNNEPKYKMTISLSVLDHLGRGLYSNVPAVLSEVVANAWDADAENVDIRIDSDKKEIVICDDGSGMTDEDINRKFLNVGYQKRIVETNAGITDRGRKPMGKKGIGKLSVFAIADTVEIHTVRDDTKSAFKMDFNDITESIKIDPKSDYHPVDLGSNEIEINKGTKVILSDLRKQRTPAIKFIRQRLARRFSIIGKDNFSISINGSGITARDRNFYDFIEYVWYFGEQRNLPSTFPNALNKVPENYIYGDMEEYTISGWIGTVGKQGQIDEDTNGIVIFASGKLVHENLLKDMMQGGVWTKYVIGEIEADFMDETNSEDIITSARQSLNENDDRYADLKRFLEDGVIKRIATNWLKWRREAGAERTLRERKNVKRWFDRLGPDQQKNAKQLFGKIEALIGMDEEGKRELYKASMFAFQRLCITDQLSILSSLETEKDFELISKLFGSLTDLARAHYYDIAKVRIAVIEKFKRMVDENQKEKVIQEHIFKAPWLLDSSWERAAINTRMEESVTKEFGKITQQLSDAEKRARIDLRYQTVSGSHVIIELKRYGARVEIYTLLAQLEKYKTALRKCLNEFPEQYSRMPIIAICITGRRTRSEDVDRLLIAANARWMTYNDLIDNALASYQNYLKAEQRISELVEIIESIDEDFDT